MNLLGTPYLECSEGGVLYRTINRQANEFARCPRCYRQELTTWSEQYYRPGRWTTLLLRLCATPYRCSACRCNFASFKPCKEKYSWRRPGALGAFRDDPTETRVSQIEPESAETRAD